MSAIRKRPVSLLLLFWMILLPAAATPKDFVPAVDLIPDTLRNSADAVVRFARITITIKSEKNISYHQHYAVTVMNKNGLKHGVFQEMYDKSIRLNHFRGARYDAAGKRTKKISGSDLKDISAASGGNLYVDSRLMIYVPETKDFPFTVEYEWDTDLSGTVMIPPWIPQDAYYLGVMEASLQITAPADKMLRYEGRRLPEPERTVSEGQETLSWQVDHLPPLHPEPVSVSLADRVPVLYLAPQHFYYAHSQGDMTSWAGLGKWIAGLNRGRRDLPETTRKKIRTLTASLDSRREKARAVYRYMQQHTRYVSVQLGIGGYQPYPASYVDEKGYGDCKALCNYTCALLEAAGVDARYVLVKAGQYAGDIITSFPSNQFNHVIVAIPDDTDTLWLECTSQSQPFDFLGSFTANRHALMITGDSGMIVHTPKYTMTENTQYRHVEVKINDDGSATATVNTHYGGLQYENVEQALTLKGEELKNYYYHFLDIPNFQIHNITLADRTTGSLPLAEEKAAVQMKKYLTIQGQRAFLPLNLMNKAGFIPKQNGRRQSDIYLPVPFSDVDTIVWNLPAGYIVQYAPSPVTIRSPFGDYESHTETVAPGQLLYIRRLNMKEGRFPKEMFGKLEEFQKKIVHADRQKVLLKKSAE